MPATPSRMLLPLLPLSFSKPSSLSAPSTCFDNSLFCPPASFGSSLLLPVYLLYLLCLYYLPPLHVSFATIFAPVSASTIPPVSTLRLHVSFPALAQPLWPTCSLCKPAPSDPLPCWLSPPHLPAYIMFTPAHLLCLPSHLLFSPDAPSTSLPIPHTLKTAAGVV